MPFRFRRTLSLGRFFRINIGKKSVSTRIGPKGFGYTSGMAGKRITTGIPGTGLSFTKKLDANDISPPEIPDRRSAADRLPFIAKLAILAAIIALFWWLNHR